MANFLFMDESKGTETGIVALTGILVPLDRYNDLRMRFYELMLWAIEPAEQTVKIGPLELHGNSFLSWHEGADDDLKLRLLADVASLVVDERVAVYRVGYHRQKRLNTVLAGDVGYLSLCWNGMLTVLQPVYAAEHLIPVMDGLDLRAAQMFSQTVRTSDVMRAVGLEGSLSFGNTENILGEVFYSDSRYSIFTQVADIVSYLRHIGDKHAKGIVLSDFQQQLSDISELLKPMMAFEEIILMKVRNG